MQFAAFGGGANSNGGLHNVYSLQLCSLLDDTNPESISAVEVPIICKPLHRPHIPISVLESFPGIEFADPETTSGDRYIY
jgi:hypothetical protein